MSNGFVQLSAYFNLYPKPLRIDRNKTAGFSSTDVLSKLREYTQFPGRTFIRDLSLISSVNKSSHGELINFSDKEIYTPYGKVCQWDLVNRADWLKSGHVGRYSNVSGRSVDRGSRYTAKCSTTNPPLLKSSSRFCVTRRRALISDHCSVRSEIFN